MKQRISWTFFVYILTFCRYFVSFIHTFLCIIHVSYYFRTLVVLYERLWFWCDKNCRHSHVKSMEDEICKYVLSAYIFWLYLLIFTLQTIPITKYFQNVYARLFKKKRAESQLVNTICKRSVIRIRTTYSHLSAINDYTYSLLSLNEH